MPPRYWSCPACSTRNPRTKQKCAGDGCKRSRPKPRVAKHAVALRDVTYQAFEAFNRDVHGAEPDACGVCGRPKHEAMNHHREHDHVTGNPRGLACFQCNSLMPRLLTLERAELVVAYLRRVHEHYEQEEAA